MVLVHCHWKCTPLAEVKEANDSKEPEAAVSCFLVLRTCETLQANEDGFAGEGWKWISQWVGYCPMTIWKKKTPVVGECWLSIDMVDEIENYMCRGWERRAPLSDVHPLCKGIKGCRQDSQ